MSDHLVLTDINKTLKRIADALEKLAAAAGAQTPSR
jgi:hypothetical protein